MDPSVKATTEILSFVKLLHSKKGVIKLPAHLPLLRGLELMAIKGTRGSNSVIKRHHPKTVLTHCLRVLDLLKLPKNAEGARQALFDANLWTDTEMNKERWYTGDKNSSSLKLGEV